MSKDKIKKKRSILKNFQSKFKQKRQIKRPKITQVNLKTHKTSYIKKIKKRTEPNH
jgi:hypothetical protein